MPLPAQAEPVYRNTYVVMATFLGGAFAGGILLGLNLERAQGRRRAGGIAAVLGLLVAMAGGWGAHQLGLPYGVLPLLFAVAIAGLHQRLLEREVRAAVDEGAADGSVVGFGTVTLLGVAQSMAWAAVISRPM